MSDVGASLYSPDIFPVPTREVLRNMMEESLRGSQSPEHLASWNKLVGSKNVAKNQIARLGRIFELQHYCRILQERYPEAIRRRQGALERALAIFMDVSSETVHRDLQFIRRRLGAGWTSRANNMTKGMHSVRIRLRPR